MNNNFWGLNRYPKHFCFSTFSEHYKKFVYFVCYYTRITSLLYTDRWSVSGLVSIKSPPWNHCTASSSSPPICVSACAATDLDFLRLFLLLLSLVNTTHLPTQPGFPLADGIVCRSTSVRLATFDWPTLLFFFLFFAAVGRSRCVPGLARS